MDPLERYLTKKRRKGRKVDRIFRILLDLPYRKRTIYRISKEANSDYHWTSNVLKDLENIGLIEGSKVVRPKDLFILWAKRPTDTLYRDYFVQNHVEVLKGADLDYAATTYFAENQVGRYLFPSRLDLYIHEKDSKGWHELLSRNGFVGKGNVRIMLSDDHVFMNPYVKGPLKTVCIQQLIVDLLREGGVCIEAAEMLIGRFYGTERAV